MNIIPEIKQELGRLVLFEPFFATIALSLDLEQSSDPACTAGVNKQKMVFGEKFWAGLNRKQRRTLIAHECLHLANMHDLREPAIINGDPELFKLWNQACDWAINGHLTGDRFEFPPDGCTDEITLQKYAGKSAEEIFKDLYDDHMLNNDDDQQDDQQSDDQQGDQGGDDQQGDQGGNDQQSDQGGNESGSGDKSEQPDNGWGQIIPSDEKSDPADIGERKQLINQAIQAGKRAGGDLAGIERDFDKLQQPQVDWRDLLSHWIEGMAQNDWSYLRTKQSGNLLLPSLHSPATGKIACIIDTSGSMSKDQVSQAIAELLTALRVFEDDGIDQSITTLFTDTAVHECFELSDEQDLEIPAGGGGTDFKNAFEKIKELDDQPLGIVVLTDGYVRVSPSEEPACDCVFIVDGSKTFKPPFGEVIEIN